MSQQENLLDRLRTHIYLNDIHPVEWFEDFDKLRSGRVTKDRFRRCFEFLKFKLTDQEFAYLCDTFADRGDVNYRAFCHTIQDIFTNQEFETEPTGQTQNPEAIVARTTGKILEDISPELDKLFSKLYHQVKTKGIHVREAFMDFDRNNNGRVTASQFLRANPFVDLNAHELQMLLQRYMDPVLRDVNYKRLHFDLQAYADLPRNSQQSLELDLPHHRDSFKFNPLPSNPRDVISRFATYCKKNRVRIRDFFQFQDTLNVGKITSDKFMNVLTLFGFQFSPEELEDLAQRYKIVEGYTDYSKWREFCNDVEAAMKNVNAVLTREVAIVNPRALKVLDDIKGYVARNRINILPPFQDFDRSKRGYVTELQFGRVLSILKVPIKDADVAVLVDVYGGQNGVDYFKFVEDVDPAHAQKRRTFKPIGATRESIEEVYGHTPAGDAFVTTEQADQLIYESKKGLLPKIAERTDFNDLMSEIQRWAYTHCVMFHDFLHDFDPLNSGEVTETQFRSAVLMSGYRLTDPEFEVLVNHYKSTKKRGYVQWRKFADDVKAFVAPPGLEVSPTTRPLKPQELMTKTICDKSTRAIPTPQIKRILHIVNRFCIARRVSLTEQFVDKDRFNHKQITPTAFAQVIQLLGVHVSKGEIDQLCTFYLDPTTNFVKYPEFIEDVRNLGGINFGEDAATCEVVNPVPEYTSMDISHYVASRPKLTADQLEWNRILPRLQSWAYKRRVRVYDFFENFDHLRHGTVTQQKFRTVVGEIDMPLTEDEMQFVGKLFALQDKPDLFNYRLLCEQINQVFGVKDLHRTPSHDATCRAAYLPDPSLTTTEVNSQERQAVDRIIQRMQRYISTRRQEVRAEFQDYDRVPHKNYITKTQFKRCISRLNLSTDENELELLARRYRCTDLDECNYNAFCNDIEATMDLRPPFSDSR